MTSSMSDVKLLALYPNPVQQGNLITIETGNVENGELHFFDAQGKRVKEVLQRRKLVVQ